MRNPLKLQPTSNPTPTLARPIIENDDRDEIRALARDLLVMMEA